MCSCFILFATFTLAALFSVAQGRRYKGCFETSEFYENVGVEGDFTVEKCAEACLNINKLLAVIQQSDCRCSLSIFTDRLDLKSCNIECDNNNMCGGQNSVSIYVASVPLVESEEEKTQSTANFPSFEGCFSDDKMEFDDLAQSWDQKNSNLRCAQHCRREGYIISASKASFCGCANTLPPILFASAVDIKQAAGENSRCNKRCEGMISHSDKCRLDECCGGDAAFTIYTTGEVNAIRQLLVSTVNALNTNNQELLRKYIPTAAAEGNFLSISETDWLNDYDQRIAYDCPDDGPLVGLYSVHTNGLEDRRFKARCGKANRLQPYNCVWTDYINGFKETFNFKCPDGKYISGMESYHENVIEDRRWKFECCNSQRIPLKTGCEWTGDINSLDNVMDFRSSPQGNSFIQGIQSVFYNAEKDRIYKICVAKAYGNSLTVPFSVTLRAKLNSYSNGGKPDDGNFVCTLKNTDRDHSCKPATNLGLHYTKVYMKNMQRLLVHGTPTSVEPLGEFDTEYDNSHSSNDNTLTKTFQVTRTTETSFSTNAGINIGVEMGATVGTEANIFGQKISAEFSTTASIQTSLTIGYSKTNSDSISETFSTSVTVPAGKKVLLNLFKEKYDLSVKWRGNLEAVGFIEIEVEGGKSVRADMGEILDEPQRHLYAFGTLSFGDRQKITAVTAFFDSNGDVSKPSPPEPSIQFDKESAEKEMTSKYGLKP